LIVALSIQDMTHAGEAVKIASYESAFDATAQRAPPTFVSLEYDRWRE
jgi:hypothetical protein